MGDTMQLLKLLPSTVSIFLLSSVLSLAVAAERDLVLVTNDVDKETAKMVYELDEESGMIKHLYRETYSNGQRVDRVELFAKDLLGQGIILHRKDNFITVRLYSHNFDTDRGGVLYLDTLHNGLNGDRKEYVIDMSIDGEKAQMYYNKNEFNRMHFIAKRSKLFGVIGIDKVNFSK
jgi:hypothetical protein